MAQKNNMSFEELMNNILSEIPETLMGIFAAACTQNGYVLRFSASKHLLEARMGVQVFKTYQDAEEYRNTLTFGKEMFIIFYEYLSCRETYTHPMMTAEV